MTNNKQLQDLIKQVLLSVHPVGSLFITEDSRNPDEILFAGGYTTWIKIEGRTILGSSASHTVGEKGGEETHTLTLQEAPAHTHTRGSMNITGHLSPNVTVFTGKSTSGAFYTFGDANTADGAFTSGDKTGVYGYGFDASRSWTGETSSRGGNQPHNNMMPYEVFNIWKRTA